MANTEIKLITSFVAKDGETEYSQPKQDLELTVAQIISFSYQNSGLGKTTTSARYDLDEIPCEYAMMVNEQIQGISSCRQSARRAMDGGP